MPELDIGSKSFTVYADLDTAEDYVAGATGTAADAWREAEEADKQRALITATRILDRQSWGTDYATFAARAAVDAIVSASIEVALALIEGTDVANATTEQTQKRVKAGSVEVENFRMASEDVSRFPLAVQELLRPYLAGAGAAIGGVSTGTCRESISPLCLGYNKGL